MVLKEYLDITQSSILLDLNLSIFNDIVSTKFIMNVTILILKLSIPHF